MPFISGEGGGGGGSVTPPVTLTGTAPATTVLDVEAAPAQTVATFVARAAGGSMQVSDALGGVNISGQAGWMTAGGPALEVTDASGLGVTSNWITEFAGDAGSFIFKVSGHAYITAHAAPADGDLSAGELAFWFDQTNGVGATKLMLKAKSADGTVKTATIVLA